MIEFIMHMHPGERATGPNRGRILRPPLVGLRSVPQLALVSRPRRLLLIKRFPSSDVFQPCMVKIRFSLY